MNIIAKYAPRQLADICGQQLAARKLTAFAHDPKTKFFLFHGAGGVGKTTAARLLAAALGVDLDWDFHSGNAASLTKQGVEAFVGHWWTRPHGRWQVFVIENCDDMPASVQRTFMTRMDPPHPANTVVIFTSNSTRFTLPFLDRFAGGLRFESRRCVLLPHLRDLASRVWQAEVGTHRNFMDDELVLPGADASTRSMMLRLEDAVREQLHGGAVVCGHFPAEMGFAELRNQLGVDDETLLAYFDEAGHDVRVGRTGPRGKNRRIEWSKVEPMLRWVVENRSGDQTAVTASRVLQQGHSPL